MRGITVDSLQVQVKDLQKAISPQKESVAVTLPSPEEEIVFSPPPTEPLMSPASPQVSKQTLLTADESKTVTSPHQPAASLYHMLKDSTPSASPASDKVPLISSSAQATPMSIFSLNSQVGISSPASSFMSSETPWPPPPLSTGANVEPFKFSQHASSSTFSFAAGTGVSPQWPANFTPVLPGSSSTQQGKPTPATLKPIDPSFIPVVSAPTSIQFVSQQPSLQIQPASKPVGFDFTAFASGPVVSSAGNTSANKDQSFVTPTSSLLPPEGISSQLPSSTVLFGNTSQIPLLSPSCFGLSSSKPGLTNPPSTVAAQSSPFPLANANANAAVVTKSLKDILSLPHQTVSGSKNSGPLFDVDVTSPCSMLNAEPKPFVSFSLAPTVNSTGSVAPFSFQSVGLFGSPRGSIPITTPTVFPVGVTPQPAFGSTITSTPAMRSVFPSMAPSSALEPPKFNTVLSQPSYVPSPASLFSTRQPPFPHQPIIPSMMTSSSTFETPKLNTAFAAISQPSYLPNPAGLETTSPLYRPVVPPMASSFTPPVSFAATSSSPATNPAGFSSTSQLPLSHQPVMFYPPTGDPPQQPASGNVETKPSLPLFNATQSSVLPKEPLFSMTSMGITRAPQTDARFPLQPFSFSLSTGSNVVPLLGSATSNQDSEGPEALNASKDEDSTALDFKPIVNLPVVSNLTSGEENEEVLFCNRGKLFRFDGTWKDRGVGEMKILRNKTTGKSRLLMRRENILKVCCNHLITENMELVPQLGGKQAAWSWFTVSDYSDTTPKAEKFCIRFKEEDISVQFKNIFDSCCIQEEEDFSESESTKPPETELFSKPTGSYWECSNCLIQNSISVTICAACSESKPAPTDTTDSPSQDVDDEDFWQCPKCMQKISSSASACSACKKPSLDADTDRTESDSDIEITCVEVPSQEDIENAKQYMLPPTFYLYKNKPPCPGCIGCASDDEDEDTLKCSTDQVEGDDDEDTLKEISVKDSSSGLALSPEKVGSELLDSVAPSQLPASEDFPSTGRLTPTELTGPSTPPGPSTPASSPISTGPSTPTKHEQPLSGSSNSVTPPPTPSQDAKTELAVLSSPPSVYATPTNDKEAIHQPSTPPLTPPPVEDTTPKLSRSPTPKNHVTAKPSTPPCNPEEDNADTFPPAPNHQPASEDSVLKHDVESSKPSEHAPFEGSSFNTTSFATLAASSKSVFGSSTSFSFPGANMALFSSPQKQESQEDYNPEKELEIQFEPVTTLPEAAGLKSGEESENTIFCHRAKLYRFDSAMKQWKERGVGDIKILKHNETHKARVLMRRQQILKLCCNHYITAEMKLEPLQNSDVSWMWFTACDFADEKPKPERFSVRFKVVEIADQFKNLFDKEVSHASLPLSSMTSLIMPKPKDQFSVPEQPSLECDVCYAQNSPNSEICKSPLSRENAVGETTSCTYSSEDVIFSHEELPEPHLIEKALQYKLPRSFYLYERKPACPGCIGCKDDSSDEDLHGMAHDSNNTSLEEADTLHGFNNQQTKHTTEHEVSSVEKTSTETNTHEVQLLPRMPFEATSTQLGVSLSSKQDSTLSAKPISSQLSSHPSLFSSASSMISFSDLVQDQNSKGFRKSSNFQFSGAGKPLFSSGESHHSEDYSPEAEADIHFKPIVSLPESYKFTSWDDNAEELFCYRAKLYRFDSKAGQWKERGAGDMKIMKKRETGKSRLIMRRDNIKKLCCNHYITDEIELMPHGNDRSWRWFTSSDFTDEEPKPEQLALRFRHPETAQEFKEVFDKCRAGNKLVPDLISTSDQPSTAVGKDLMSSVQTWTCDTCCVVNACTDTKCIACGCNNEQSTASEQGKTVPAAAVTFGSSGGLKLSSPLVLQPTSTAPLKQAIPGTSGPPGGFKLQGFSLLAKEELPRPHVAEQGGVGVVGKQSTPDGAKDLQSSVPSLSTETWECNTCCVVNVSSDAKCVACGCNNEQSTASACGWNNEQSTASEQGETVPATAVTFGSSGGLKLSSPLVLQPTSTAPLKQAIPGTSGPPGGFKLQGFSLLAKEELPRPHVAEQGGVGVVGKQSTPDGDLQSSVPSLSAETWECNMCYVVNVSSDAKCVACGCNNEQSTASEQSKTVPATVVCSTSHPPFCEDLTSNVQSNAETWTCNTCCVVNACTDTKCIACGCNNEQSTASEQGETVPATAVTFGSSGGLKLSSPLVLQPTSTAPLKQAIPGTSGPPGGFKLHGLSLLAKEELPRPHVAEQGGGAGVVGDVGNLPTPDGAKDLGAKDLGSSVPSLSAETWECNTCSVVNVSSDAKCVACGCNNEQSTASETAPTTTVSEVTFGSSGGLKLSVPLLLQASPFAQANPVIESDSESSLATSSAGGFKIPGFSLLAKEGLPTPHAHVAQQGGVDTVDVDQSDRASSGSDTVDSESRTSSNSSST